MLPKHSKDVVYIVIILVLLAIMVGVPNEFWTVIIINILIISIGLIYVKLTSIEEKIEISLQKEKKNEKVSENPYVQLYNLAEVEKDECDENADYDSFDAIRDSHAVIAKYMSGELTERKLVSDISHICKTKLLIYYLGLESILKADVNRMNVLDKQYIDIGIKLLRASHFDKKAPTLEFISKRQLI